MRDRADLAGAADRAGLTITQIETLPDGSIASRMSFEDPWAAARLLVELTDQDAGDPVVRMWAFEILAATAGMIGETDDGPTLSPELLAAFVRAVHYNVITQIKFRHEPVETFQSARLTLELGAGDCDDHARLLVATLKSAGVEARLAFFESGDQPSHVVPLVRDGEGWWWAETTIDARFGEPPLDALDRLVASGVDLGRNPFEGDDSESGIGAVTPSDVLAYRNLWDDYVMGTARAAAACAASLPAGSVEQGTQQANADAIVLRWNAYAGWSDAMIVLEAAGILEAFQDAVLRVGQFYQPQIHAACPSIALPSPADTNLQASVIGAIEGQGILAHGVLQLLGLGVGGALSTLGAIASAPLGKPFWDTTTTLAIAAAVVAGALAVREVALTARR
jgi:Transglutaminase-like superfamily